jgi:FkbM family methyltransferase
MTLVRLKASAKARLRSYATVFGGTKLGRTIFEQILDSSMSRTRKVSHRGIELTFTEPNALNRFRTETFATKEPETLQWIDSVPLGATLWDIGANIGLYSCYAAKARGCRVIAFEPSVFNLELLARNIFVNGLTSKVTIVPLPLFECVAESTLNMTSTQWGGALSTFGADYGFDGTTLNPVFEFRTVGLPMDECVTKLAVPLPEFIKMDVDGIEHLILRGGAEVLRRVRSVAIEINDAFIAQAQESQRLLAEAGLRFVSKAHSPMIDDNPMFNRTFNQVWSR